MTLKKDLEEWLRGCLRLVILGVGNPLRGDDALGLEILKRLRGRLPRSVKIIWGDLTPENFVEKIKMFNPSHVLFIDAAHFNGKPGEAMIVSPKRISGVAVSTHALPLYILAEIIRESTGAKVILLGIKPKNLNLGDKISPEIRESIERNAGLMVEIINKVMSQING